MYGSLVEEVLKSESVGWLAFLTSESGLPWRVNSTICSIFFFTIKLSSPGYIVLPMHYKGATVSPPGKTNCTWLFTNPKSDYSMPKPFRRKPTAI